MRADTFQEQLTRSVSEADAAQYIGMSTSYLRQSRYCGDGGNRTPGPTYLKIGRSVRYLIDDLDNWLEKHRAPPMTAPSVGPEDTDAI